MFRFPWFKQKPRFKQKPNRNRLPQFFDANGDEYIPDGVIIYDETGADVTEQRRQELALRRYLKA